MSDNQQATTEDRWRRAALIWDYHQMHHQLRPVDPAIGLGSHDLGVATHSAKLYRSGLFPALVFTGGNSPTTAKVFCPSRREAVVEVADALLAQGMALGARIFAGRGPPVTSVVPLRAQPRRGATR